MATIMPLIFRPYRTLPNGEVIWARNYGLRAFPIFVDEIRQKKEPADDAADSQE